MIWAERSISHISSEHGAWGFLTSLQFPRPPGRIIRRSASRVVRTMMHLGRICRTSLQPGGNFQGLSASEATWRFRRTPQIQPGWNFPASGPCPRPGLPEGMGPRGPGLEGQTDRAASTARFSQGFQTLAHRSDVRGRAPAALT